MYLGGLPDGPLLVLLESPLRRRLVTFAKSSPEAASIFVGSFHIPESRHRSKSTIRWTNVTVLNQFMSVASGNFPNFQNVVRRVYSPTRISRPRLADTPSSVARSRWGVSEVRRQARSLTRASPPFSQSFRDRPRFKVQASVSCYQDSNERKPT